MAFERTVAKFFGLDDEGWMRHANPWSGLTRMPCLAIFVLSLWSRVWLGWYSLVPIAIVLVWTYINPRIFPKPKSTQNWFSKAVFGERIWSNRDEIAIPEHHRIAPKVLALIAATGLLPLAWGVYQLDFCATVCGTMMCYFGKLWFLDRMVWLYEDMKHLPEYKDWLY